MPRRPTTPDDDDDPFLPDEGDFDETESDDEGSDEDDPQPIRRPAAARSSLINANTLATVGLLVLGVLVGVMIYAVVQRSASATATTDVAPSPAVDSTGTKPIQLDVLNGCGAAGVGTKFRAYLQGRGFDVVASENYNTFNVVESLVIDRRGDMIGARKVARSLGIADQNVIQQVSNDYYLDVSVVVGRDFARLRPYQN